MRKTVLIVLAAFAISIAAPDGVGFNVSVMTPDLSALSADFNAAGLPAVSDTVFALGGGVWGGEKNIVLGFSGFWSSQKADGTDASVNLQYNGFFVEPGYFLNFWRGLGVMPSAGIGMTKVKMEIREDSLGDIDFDDLLEDPGRVSKARFRTFTVAPALTINIPIEFINLQLKGGYMWSPFNGKWKLEDKSSLTLTPAINPSGLFANVGIVFGDPDEMVKEFD